MTPAFRQMAEKARDRTQIWRNAFRKRQTDQAALLQQKTRVYHDAATTLQRNLKLFPIASARVGLLQLLYGHEILVKL